MDQLRNVLLALARRTSETQHRWQAGCAAVRGRGLVPDRTEAFAHFAQAQRCLITALTAARTGPRWRIDGIEVSRDPLKAARQLVEHVGAHHPDMPIELQHEAARQAYLAAFDAPLTSSEVGFAMQLAALPAARRDKVNDLAELLAEHREPA